MYQHPSDWHNDEDIIRQADAQGMGIVLMRSLTSGVFQRLMADAFPEIDAVSGDGSRRGPPAARLRPLGLLRRGGAGGLGMRELRSMELLVISPLL